MTTGLLAGVRHRLLGAIVFAAAIALWEVWARTHTSFLVPTASAVAERAWQVWPSGDFVLTVVASVKRLAG